MIELGATVIPNDTFLASVTETSNIHKELHRGGPWRMKCRLERNLFAGMDVSSFAYAHTKTRSFPMKNRFGVSNVYFSIDANCSDMFKLSERYSY